MKMYHLSRNELHNEILKPRVPDNFFTQHGFEENTIKRICFSDSVDRCLMALSQNLKGKVLWVYKPKDLINVVTNKEIVKNNYVPDGQLTKEIWSLEDTQLIAVAKIKIIKPMGELYFFKYGENIAYDCNWHYEVLKRYKT